MMTNRLVSRVITLGVLFCVTTIGDVHADVSGCFNAPGAATIASPEIPSCLRPIRPTLECVRSNRDRTYTAFFSYISEKGACCDCRIDFNTGVVTCDDTTIPTIPIQQGTIQDPRENYFLPDPINRGQPTKFPSSTTPVSFGVTWDGEFPLKWVLTDIAMEPGDLFPSYRTYSVVADSNDENVICPDEPPTSIAGGPYVAACAGVETNITLDGTGSSDPQGYELSFLWSAECEDDEVLTIDNPSQPSTTARTLVPGLGRALSCTIRLTVSSGDLESTSETTLSVAACPLDCASTPNGTAVLDQCGVCDGNNACLDCLGVPNGGAQVDQCGVCGGDGTSCLDCTEGSNVPGISDLDIFAAQQRNVVLSAARRLTRSKNATAADRRLAHRLVREAGKLYEISWILSWSFPSISVVCTNAELCSTQDLSTLVNQYESNAGRLRRIALQLNQRARRRGVGNTTGMLRRINARFNQAVAQVKTIPTKQSSCS